MLKVEINEFFNRNVDIYMRIENNNTLQNSR